MIGDALEGISLESHPDKTEVIVSGRNKKAELMREALTKNPAMMQGHPVKVSDSGMYLGMRLSQKGHRDTVDQSVKHRVAKAWSKVADIKTVINDGRARKIGWLRSGVTLIKAIIIPSLMYGGDTWVAMNKSTENFLKTEYKAIVYIILDITTHTKWTSVLSDLGLPNIMAVVDKMRMNYMSHVLWRKGDEKLKEIILEEHRISPKNSALSKVDEICERYRLPKVSEVELDKKIVKKQVRLVDETEIWLSNLRSPAVINTGLARMRQAVRFYRLNKRESQALIALNAGAFKLKTSWGDYHEVKSCLAPMCGQRDELGHIKKCPYYNTKWKEEFSEDSKMLAKYLVGVDMERRKRWKGECLF